MKHKHAELADWIENGAPFGKYETAKQAVVMLRQQQAEIEALKTDNKRLKGYCWESDEAIEFLKAVKEAQEK